MGTTRAVPSRLQSAQHASPALGTALVGAELLPSRAAHIYYQFLLCLLLTKE